jgi:hypothetical protein
VAVPDEHVGGTYNDLALALMGQGAVPLGLYRHGKHASAYVATNPRPSTTLAPDDQVYVLA